MQERQVTVGGQRHDLPQPFFVLATQNPIEQEGTYPLPEAQLDRFLFQIQIRYPSLQEEMEIVRKSADRGTESVSPVLDGETIRRMQNVVRHMRIADHVIAYALRLVRATRIKDAMDLNLTRPSLIQKYLAWGAGPRASENLVLAAKACAALEGAEEAQVKHVRAVAKPVLRHRVIMNFNAEADQVTADDVVENLLKEIPVDGHDPREKRQMDEVLR
jgi:MoxR-like ATPase